jgi:hypothetical protein
MLGTEVNQGIIVHEKQAMSNELTSKEYWDQYWTPDQIKYSNYNPKKVFSIPTTCSLESISKKPSKG